MRRRTRSVRLLLAVAGAALLLAPLAPASAIAGRAGPATAPSVLGQSHTHSELSLSARAADAGTWAIEAHMRDVSSGPMAGVTVEFSATIDFLGVRTLDLGSARTDTSGTATLTYHPTAEGLYHIVARAPFDDGVALSNEAVVDMTGATRRLAPPEQRLPVVGAWAGRVAALVVASVWGLLVLVLVRVVAGISRAPALAQRPPAGPQRPAPTDGMG